MLQNLTLFDGKPCVAGTPHATLTLSVNVAEVSVARHRVPSFPTYHTRGPCAAFSQALVHFAYQL